MTTYGFKYISKYDDFLLGQRQVLFPNMLISPKTQILGLNI